MSQLRHKLKPLLIMLLAVALLFSLVGPAWAQNGDTDGEPVETQDEALTCDHPVLASLIQEMAEANPGEDGVVDESDLNAACTALDPYLDVGVGQIMKAWYLSESLPGYAEGANDTLTTWQNLLDLHRTGQGWGEVMFAYRFAASLEESDLTGEQLLTMKKSGLGWGQIAKAQAVAEAESIPLDQVLPAFENDAEWEDIRGTLGLEPGRPPWAGPPPWAKGNPKKNDVDGEELEGDESSGSGAPAFSGPPDQNRGNGPGNGRGNGLGNGNGNAYGHNKNK